MKKLSVFVIVSLLTFVIGSLAMANNLLLDCSGVSGDLNIKVIQHQDQSLIAKVTVESTGGSYPSFVYRVKSTTDSSNLIDGYTGKNIFVKVYNSVGADKNYKGFAKIYNLGTSEALSCKIFGVLQ